MTIQLIIGLFLSFMSGMSLGLLGGGGSMLMVPILYYVMKYTTAESTLISLLIVGFTSLIGAVSAFKRREVAVRQALVFVVPSLVGVFLMRGFILPAIPEALGIFWGHAFTKSAVIMALFSVALFYVGLRILKTPASVPAPSGVRSDVLVSSSFVLFKTLFSGFGVGSFTGLIGAGGGFLIVPALTLLLKLPFRIAIGTSLFVIAINSIVGVATDFTRMNFENWETILFILVSSIVGMLVGMKLSEKVSTVVLKKLFAIIVLTLGIVIVAKEFL